MRLTLLGTGTPSPSLRRQSSGYLIETTGKVIVVDHGGGAFHRLLETGTRPTDITHLFVSHLHSDHILDIPRLVLTRWDQSDGTLPALNVYGPSPLARTFDSLFSPEGVFGPDIRARREHPASLAIFAARGGAPPRKPPETDLREVQPDDRLELDGLQIHVGRSQHFEPMLDCLCYRFKTEAGDLVYAGDSGFSETLVSFAAGCDVLIAMCQYLDETPVPPKARATAASHIEVARMAQMAGTRTLVLSHLSEQFDDPMAKAKAHREMAEFYSGDIIWGEDALSLTVGVAAKARRFD